MATTDEKNKYDWLDTLELPLGFHVDDKLSDDYALYVRDDKDRIYLAKAKAEDERIEYNISDGCFGIFKNAFTDSHFLKKLTIPKTVCHIPEGSLSNSGSWAEMERGLEAVEIDPKNDKYFSDNFGVFERMQDGIRLILCLADIEKDGNEIVLSDKIIDVGKDAFCGKRVYRITFANGFSYSFPRHAFFNEELLKQFGQNGVIYDFTEYDAFLLRSHFNADRIRMICERLLQDYMISGETKCKLFSHIKDNLTEALNSLATENAVEELRMMSEVGFFDSENIDSAIDVLNRTDNRELMTYLMDYKHENLRTVDFDFSI